MRKPAIAAIIILMTVKISSIFGADNSNSDSLIQLANKARQSEKAMYLNQAAQSFLPQDPNKALKYALQANQYAMRNSNLLQSGLAYKITGASYYNLFDYEKALENYNTAIEQFKKVNDNNQIAGVLINIGLVHRDRNNYALAEQSYNDALKIYQKEKNDAGVANTYNFLGSLTWKQGFFEMAIEYYNKSLAIRLKSDNKTEIAASYSNIARSYLDLNITDKAIENYLKALNYREQTLDSSLVGNTLNDLGTAFQRKGDLEKSLEYYFQSLKLRYELGDKLEIANSYINLGNIYNTLGNFDKSNEYFQDALTIYSENNQPLKLANTLTLLGNNNYQTGNFQEAGMYYKKALDIRTNIGDKLEIGRSLNNLGNIYANLNQFTKSLAFYNDALKLRRDIGDNAGILTTLNDIGNLYEISNKQAEAMNYFQQTLNMALEMNNSYFASLCARKIADIYIQNNKLQNAPNYLNIALNSGEKIKNYELVKNAHYSFYTYFRVQNNFEAALNSFQHYSQINDSLQDLKNTRKILSIQQNIEIENKNNELKNYETVVNKLKNETENKTLALARQRHFAIALIVITILTLLVAILIYNQNNIKKKVNAQLEKQNQLLNQANEQLKQQETELKSLNATKDKYFSIIAHDIKNPLSALMNLSQIIVEKFESLKPEDIQEFNKNINESATNLFNLLENLLFWARSNTQKLKFNPAPVQLSAIVRNTFLLNRLSAQQKNISLKTEVTDDINVYADLQMLTLIFRNLVSNAIKFTPENGNITISASNKGSTAEVSVTDTGIGIDPAEQKKLFAMETHFTTFGTNNETGSGLGLILVKEFIEKNNGKITLVSEPNKGSTFTFSVPNSNW